MEWIKCTDKLPPRYKYYRQMKQYLVKTPYGVDFAFFIGLNTDGSGRWFCGEEFFEKDFITHWLEMPEEE